MWEPDLPDEADHLRQGDLLDLQPMPKRGSMELLPTGLTALVKPAERAIVLERCCSVEQRKTLLLAKVGTSPAMAPDHPYALALANRIPAAGTPYAWYEHLLAETGDALPERAGKIWIVRLLERVSVAGKDHDDLAPYRARRVARMTVPARAQFRAKLAAHFARPENDDEKWLSENGYNSFGELLHP